jgi:hypothetical protein
MIADPETLANDTFAQAMFDAALEDDASELDTLPELPECREARSWRVWFADGLETFGVAVALLWWGLVAWIRGTA